MMDLLSFSESSPLAAFLERVSRVLRAKNQRAWVRSERQDFDAKSNIRPPHDNR